MSEFGEWMPYEYSAGKDAPLVDADPLMGADLARYTGPSDFQLVIACLTGFISTTAVKKTRKPKGVWHS